MLKIQSTHNDKKVLFYLLSDLKHVVHSDGGGPNGVSGVLDHRLQEKKMHVAMMLRIEGSEEQCEGASHREADLVLLAGLVVLHVDHGKCVRLTTGRETESSGTLQIKSEGKTAKHTS